MRLFACLGLCILLAGCSDYGDDAGSAVAVPVVAPAPAPVAMDDSFCRNAAAGDANGHGYDQATQARVTQQSYAQCKALFAR